MNQIQTDIGSIGVGRREMMAALTAAMVVSLLPAPAGAAQPVKFRKPSRLKAGDVVGLVSPASAPPDPAQIDKAVATLTAMGFQPKLGPHARDRYGYLAGTDKDRAADVNAMFADKDVKAIFAVRGGWGCARILPHLDWTVIRANPKLLIGYSDITALHMAFAKRAGFTTLHAPVGTSPWNPSSFDSFKRVAMDAGTPTFVNPFPDSALPDAPSYPTQTIRGGKARGRLWGGNLTVLTAMVGTSWLPSFKGAVLFLEDVEEAEYRVDRMLTQLAQAGILSEVAGVVFGQCTGCEGKSLTGFTLTEVLEQHLKPLNVPVYTGAWFGHITDQFTLPEGGLVELDADAGTLRLLEPAVA